MKNSEGLLQETLVLTSSKHALLVFHPPPWWLLFRVFVDSFRALSCLELASSGHKLQASSLFYQQASTCDIIRSRDCKCPHLLTFPTFYLQPRLTPELLARQPHVDF